MYFVVGFTLSDSTYHRFALVWVAVQSFMAPVSFCLLKTSYCLSATAHSLLKRFPTTSFCNRVCSRMCCTSETSPESKHKIENSSMARKITPCSSPNRKRPRKASVTFAPYVSVLPNTSTKVPLTDIWYNCIDLQLFRQQIRADCRQLRDALPVDRKCKLADSEESRGLEQRSCLERQRRKSVTTSFIVNASKQMNADKLALLSQRITKWAVSLAQEEATRDYARAYCSPERRSSGEVAALKETARQVQA